MEQQFVAERVENRVGMKLTAMLIGTHGKLGVEKAVTENVSPRGVRVISTSDWYIDDTILVSLPAGHFTSAARVAYATNWARADLALAWNLSVPASLWK